MNLFRQDTLKLTCYFPLVVFMLFLFSSCGNTKKLIYFQTDKESGTNPQLPPGQLPKSHLQTVIQTDDILSITVSSADAEQSAPYNAPNESTPSTNSGASTGNTLTIGYLVDENGDIKFPVLGKLHVEGMTKLQLSEMITKTLLEKKLLVDPIVTIRYLNFRVSVIGEVARPGVYTVPNEKLSLSEAIAMAGDLTIFGKRENILLIRENGKGELITETLNLRSRDILNSPFYYLKSNDVIYVEPIRDRVSLEKSQQYLPIIFSAFSLLIVIIDRVAR